MLYSKSKQLKKLLVANQKRDIPYSELEFGIQVLVNAVNELFVDLKRTDLIENKIIHIMGPSIDIKLASPYEITLHNLYFFDEQFYLSCFKTIFEIRTDETKNEFIKKYIKIICDITTSHLRDVSRRLTRERVNAFHAKIDSMGMFAQNPQLTQNNANGSKKLDIIDEAEEKESSVSFGNDS